MSFATAGCLPEEMGIGPVYAIPKAFKLAGLTLDQIDVIELNEAFAVQGLAVMKLLEMDPAKVNVNGGAVALGHPLGCTGAKLTATILQEMKRRNARYGMVTMCVGGGMGAAGIFERLELTERMEMPLEIKSLSIQGCVNRRVTKYLGTQFSTFETTMNSRLDTRMCVINFVADWEEVARSARS